MGYIETKATANCALRHYLELAEGGDYNIRIRYCNSNKAGEVKVTVNGKAQTAPIEKVAMSDWHEAVVTATLNAGKNTLIIQNSKSIIMYIDQVTYEPVGTPAAKYKVKINDADFGRVVADVDSAAAGQEVHLTITPDDGYAIKALRLVNSIFFTQGKTIPVEDGMTEVTFIMPDDNATIQPVFYDKLAAYELDYTDVASGSLPVGWRTTDGSSVRNYPSQNLTSGPRTFAGFTGYQGKALYWRGTSAEYGRLTDYPLNLEPGNYELIFAMAAWKGAPTYLAKILNSSGSEVAKTATLTAKPNLDGNGAGDLSPAQRVTLPFTITKSGKYIIQFKNAVTSGDMKEFLVAECRIRNLSALTGIATINDLSRLPEGIYSPSGLRRQQLQRGLNIVVGSDGTARKVIIRK